MGDSDGMEQLPAEVGDLLVVPEFGRGVRWHAGRVKAVLPAGRGFVRFRVRWLGDVHDSVVVPPEGTFVATGL